VFNTDLAALSHKFAADMRDAQSEAGAFSDVTPRVGPTSDSMPGWADAGVIIPGQPTHNTGTKSLLNGMQTATKLSGKR
jgi:Bacterial alpha-L-rhamnosidase 6 hairpin glycosidase domain